MIYFLLFIQFLILACGFVLLFYLFYVVNSFRKEVPFVPTDAKVIRKMIEYADIKKKGELTMKEDQTELQFSDTFKRLDKKYPVFIKALAEQTRSFISEGELQDVFDMTDLIGKSFGVALAYLQTEQEAAADKPSNA